MYDHVFHTKTVIEFGKGAEEKAGFYAAKYGKKALIHYGGGSVKRTGLFDRVKKSLEDAGVEVFELGGVVPNPRVDLCRKGIELCRKENIDVVIGLGGGSAVDSAKCICAGMYYDGDVWDICNGVADAPEKLLPIIAIITMAGSGTEVSMGAVISSADGVLKRGIGSNRLRPDVCILNPELTYTLPPFQVAAGGMDIATHCLERVLSEHVDSELTERLALATAKNVLQNIPRALADPTDYESHSQLSYASMYAMLGWMYFGIVTDGWLHEVEHELSAAYDMTHGAGLAIMMIAYFKYLADKRTEKIAKVLHELFDVPYDYANMQNTVWEGIRRLEDYIKSIGLPTRLSEYCVPDQSRFDEMAHRVLEGRNKETVGHIYPMTPAQVVEVFKLAF